VLLAVVIVASGAGIAFAQSANSSHYSVSETEFGAGSTAQTCSSAYCSTASIGGLTGSSSSTSANYSASFGPITGSDPMLEVIVNPGTSDLGNFDSSHTSTTTTIVKIRNYLSSGYVLQIMGDPPKYGNHTLNTPTTPTASSPGTEQFGINLAANTTPSVGATPVQVPSGSFSFGVVNTGYDTANQFKYVNGDTIAHSPSQSGETDYTISMIVNISSLTPAGHYSGDFSAVVIPVY
jgi:hypothetical protein